MSERAPEEPLDRPADETVGDQATAGATPDASDNTPEAAHGMPNASDGTPDASDGTPDASDGTSNGTPNACDGIPDASDGTPDASDGIPAAASAADHPPASRPLALPARASDAPPRRSAMLDESRGLFRFLSRRVFGKDKTLDDGQAERLRILGEQGAVVYVMRTRSLLDYMLFNHLFLAAQAPLARFANGVDTTVFRGVGRWLRGRIGRLFGRAAGPPPVAQLEQAVAEEGAAALFMKVRALTAEKQERPADPAFIERLVELQASHPEPIYLVPQYISWPRKPPSKRRTLLDILFGDQASASRLRKLIYALLHGRKASVQVDEPIDLRAVVAEHGDWPPERIARKVRRVLFIHLGRAQMALTGPRIEQASKLRARLLQRPSNRRALLEVADREGLSQTKALKMAERDVREIEANVNYTVLGLVARLLDFVLNRVFEGVEVDADGLRRIKDAARHSRSAPVVLIPCHKSHFDYMVISWVMWRNEFIPPHVAAGANLSFFPLGWLFRRSGAFFLRRSFAGQPIYKEVFRQYLWALIRQGYPTEFFIEGGRSRTGKLLPPKMGMLSMLLEGVRRGEYKDLQFVPIHLSYEKVVETASYRRELTGGQKEAESVTGVVKAGKVLRARYGRVYVSFEEPVRLSDWLLDRDRVIALPVSDDPGAVEASDDHFRDTTGRLAYHLMRRIQEATVVAPSSLVGAVLLSHHRRGLSNNRLRELVGFLVAMLQARGARLSRSIEHTLKRNQGRIAAAAARSAKAGSRTRGEALRDLITEALKLLSGFIEQNQRANEMVFVVPDKSRIELDYYRNSILGILAPDCLVATALLGAERAIPLNRLAADTRKLSRIFKHEFIYRTDMSYEQAFAETVGRMIDEGLIATLDDGLCLPAAPLTLDFLRGMLLHLVEGYWIAADAMRALVDAPMEKKEWLDYAREHGEMEFLQGDIRRAEAASTAVIGNALQLFVDEGLIERQVKVGRGKKTERFALAGDRTLEDLALRRDDIGVYLLRAHDEPLRRTATDEDPSAISPTDPHRAIHEYAEDPLDDELVAGLMRRSRGPAPIAAETLPGLLPEDAAGLDGPDERETEPADEGDGPERA